MHNIAYHKDSVLERTVFAMHCLIVCCIGHLTLVFGLQLWRTNLFVIEMTLVGGF